MTAVKNNPRRHEFQGIDARANGLAVTKKYAFAHTLHMCVNVYHISVENNTHRHEFQGIGARVNGFLLTISLPGAYKFYTFALAAQSTPVL